MYKITKIASAFIALTGLSVGAAHANDSFTIRLPLLAATHNAVVTNFNFGTVVVGSTPSKTFTFVNRGSTPTTVGAVLPTGKARVLRDGCSGQTVAAGANCEMTLGVHADVTGQNTGTVSLSHSTATVPDTYNVVTNAVPASSTLRFDESQAAFGEQLIRTSSGSRTLTLRNTGDEPVVISSVGFSRLTSHFSIVSNECEGVLEGGTSCQVSIQFKPLALGTHGAALNINLEDGSTISASGLTGIGVQGLPSWSTGELNFVDVPVGTTSEPQPLVLKNAGAGPLTIKDLGIYSNNSSDPYFQLQSSTCSKVIQPGASCTVYVTFSAPDTTLRSTALQLVTDSASEPVSRVQLFARPKSLKPVLTLSPQSLNFGDQPVGVASVQTLTLRSIGELAVTVSNYKLSGANPGDFRVVNPANCLGSLSPGMQCSIQVEVNTTAAGARSAGLQVTSDSADPVSPVALSANGILGILQATPGTYVFPTTEIGQSATQAFTLKNVGQAPLTVSALSVAQPTGSTSYALDNGCAGQTLAPAQSCSVGVTFKPATAVAVNAGVNITHTGQGGSTAITLAGNGKAAATAQLTLGEFTCPATISRGAVATCTATLTNSGTVAAAVSLPGTSSNPKFSPESSCTTTSLVPGGTCAIRLKVDTSVAGTLSTDYRLAHGTGESLTRSVSLVVQEPSATFRVNPHGPVPAGTLHEAVHTVTNTSGVPVTLNGITFAPAANSGGVIRMAATPACPTTLAPGASCSIKTLCTPVAGVQHSASVSWASNVEGGSIKGTATCEGAPVQSNLAATPELLDMGVYHVGATTNEFLVRVANNGTSPVTFSTAGFTGNQRANFFVLASDCLMRAGTTTATVINPGNTCLLKFNGRALVLGSNTAVYTMSSANGASVAIPLKATGAYPEYAISPSVVDFGSVAIGGTPVTRTVRLTNTGPVSGSLPVLTVPSPNGAVTFTPRCPTTVTLNTGCDIDVVLNPVRVPREGALSATAQLTNPFGKLTLTAVASMTPQPFPNHKITVECPASAAVGTVVTCKHTLTSTGTAPLVANYWGHRIDLSPIATITGAVCTPGASILSLRPGESCVGTTQYTITKSPVTHRVSSFLSFNSPNTAFADIQTLLPGLNLTVAQHPSTQVGTFSTARHTLTNTGPIPVTPSTGIAGLPFAVDLAECKRELAPGESCSFVTKCSPMTPVTANNNLTVSAGTLVSVTKPLSCTGVLAKLVASYDLTKTTRAGAFTASGNWVTLTNAGAGPATLSSFAPAVGWTLYGSPTNSSHCSPNKTLQAGESCQVLEVLNGTQGPGASVTGMQNVYLKSGNVSWTASPITTHGVSVTQLSAFPATQMGSESIGTFQLTNQSPTALAAPLRFEFSNNVFSVASTDCPASLAAGASCRVTVRYNPTVGTLTAFSGAMRVLSGYEAVVSNVVQSGGVKSGILGSINMTASAVAPKVNLTVGTNAPVYIGQTSDYTHTLSNDGVGSITLSGEPTINGPHSVIGGTCDSGTVLAPNQSCTIVTRFAPQLNVQPGGTLTVPTSVGPRVASVLGKAYPSLDVGVSITSSNSTLVNTTSTFVMTVRNAGMSPVPVTVNLGLTPQGGATGYLSSIAGTSCGNRGFDASGAVTSSTPGVAATGVQVTCEGNDRLSQLKLRMGPNSTYTASFTVQSGGTLGSLVLSATASVTEATDSAPANNSATKALQVTYPIADMSVAVAPAEARSTATTVGLEGSTTVLATVRNNGQAASGRFTASTASVTGGATSNVVGIRCLSKTGIGATCDDAGNLSLPANGSAVFELRTNFGSALGTTDVIGNVEMTSPMLTDTPLTNNRAALRFKVDAIPTEKWCTFVSPPGTIGIRESNLWRAGQGTLKSAQYYNPSSSPRIGADDWLFSTIAYLDYNTGYAYWKGTNKPVMNMYGKHMQMGRSNFNMQLPEAFHTRIADASQFPRIVFRDTNLFNPSYYGSVLFKLPSNFPESAANSPAPYDSPQDATRYPPAKDTKGHPRVFSANWVPAVGTMIGRGAPYYQGSSCYLVSGKPTYDYPESCFWDGARTTGSMGNLWTVWREYSVGAACGASNARRLQ